MRSGNPDVYRPPGGRTERDVAAEVIVLLMDAGVIQRNPMNVAKSAEAVGIAIDAVRQAWDRRERLGRATPLSVVPIAASEPLSPTDPSGEAASSQKAGYEQLIAEGLAAPSKTVQRLAAKARDALDKLDDALADEVATREARAEVERLKRELAEVQARLRGGKGPKPAVAVATDQPSARQVREWAAAEGIPVPPRGVVPADIIERYKAEAAS